MYDIFAYEYGYTIDQFLDLTLRQLQNLSLVIERRRVKYRYPMQAFLASLQGAKIKGLDELLGDFEEFSFDEKTDKILEKRAFELLKQRQQKRG